MKTWSLIKYVQSDFLCIFLSLGITQWNQLILVVAARIHFKLVIMFDRTSDLIYRLV